MKGAKKETKDALGKKIKLNLKCSEEDKQVGQSREEEKEEEERREWVERRETGWGIDK